MKTPIAVLALLALAAVSGVAQSDMYTYISNESSAQSIVATTSYVGGNSNFINRIISPGTSQSDQYGAGVAWVHIEIWLEGAGVHNETGVEQDRSIVGYDRNDGTNGVDIYLAKYGTLTQTEGGVLCSIYLQ